MPNWNSVLAELQADSQGAHDRLRLKYLKSLSKHTGRNVLVYYSGWLQKPRIPEAEFGIGDADKTGFMTCSQGVSRADGLDLILHTPGGDIAATESIIDYLHSLYNGNIRAIIPQLAMSGGTLIALSCREIVMGRQSSIGPVDPQIRGMPAQGIIEEFNRAASEIYNDQRASLVWQPVLSKYWPTLVTSCQHAIDWADQLLRKYLSSCMLADDPENERNRKIEDIANLLGKQATSKSHNRHISPSAAKALGLNVTDLESDQKLQDLVLTLHHALTHTFAQTSAVKIMENHRGTRYVNQLVPSSYAP
jgi:hypothetical protein